ncbi:Ms4527A family Cys-rich leader peptide [Mycobacterium sp. URHB0021]
MDIDAERPPGCGHQGGQFRRCRLDGHAASLPEATFAHPERKSRPVRAMAGIRGRIKNVIAAHLLHRVSLVARRHVDFKRVCTCCCLP